MIRTRYLLDTNAISHAARFPSGPVARQMRNHKLELVTSTIVRAEIRYGLARNPTSRVGREAIRVVLESLRVLQFDDAAADHYGPIRAELEADGIPIGAMDTLIAAHTRAADLTLVTDNTAHFERVSGLRTTNWQTD